MFKKKKNTIMLIFTMLISFVLLFSMNTSYGTGITGSDKINGTKLKNGEKITLNADVVYQKNVLCAQHGTKIKSGSAYEISDEYIVEDPVLAYILTQGHEASQVKSGYWISDTQIALWMYLYNSKSDEAETITKDISCDKVVKDSKTMYTEDYNKGVELYNKAVAYGKSKNNVSVKIKNFITESGNVTFKVTGSYDGFTVKFNGAEIDTYKTSAEKDITIDPKGATEANVEVTAYKDIEKITYRILKGTKTQRLLVVTSSGGTTTGPKESATKSADLSTNVSLQKYIVATGSVFESNQLKGDSKNLGTERMDWKASEENGEAIRKDREGNKDIKNDKPVSISKGDYVIYRISVYDNEYKDGKGNITVQLKDRINAKYGILKGIYKELNSKLELSEKIDGEHYLSSKDGIYNYYRWDYEFKEKDSCYVVVQYDEEFTSSLISNKAFINTNNESQYRTVDYDFVAMTTDVSLQKYITAVGKTFNIKDKTGTLSNKTYGYNMSNRNLRMAIRDSNNLIYSEENSAYITNGNKNIASDQYKYDDPIEISKGDYVIYKIEVYNNKKAQATVTVKDRISKYGTLIGIFDTHPTDDEQLRFENRLNDLDEEDYYHENDYYYYYRWSATVEGESSNAYWVVVKYDNAKEDTIIDNRALIDDNFNESEYCTKDFDYIILKSYAVSLKKYVSKVTDKNGDNSLSYDFRLDLDTRFNAYATDTSNKSNYDEYKKKNPVLVELGDKVTYTIQLKNESSAPIIIKEIYDYYDSEALTYNDSISQGTWQSGESGSLNGRQDGKTLSDMSCAKISFGDGITLDKGATTSVDITFKVDKEKESVYNIAQVKEIYNGGSIVTDSDGPDNNTDEDWIKFKTYAVSLEKYVYQVDGKNVDSREGKAEYLTYKDGKYVDETTNNKDTEYKTNNTYKYNKAVETSNGNSVTYRIKVKNDGESSVYISEIKDYLPLGVKYEDGIEYGAVAYDGTIDSSKAISLNKLSDTLIKPGESKDILISVNVTEPNSSINVLKNIAEIAEIKNRNGIGVNDTTPNNNRDADYIVLNTGTSSDKVDYNVEKVWDDGDGTGRPNLIQVQLYQNDSEYGEPAKVSKDCDEPWKYTWKDLPKYDSDGKLYTYKAIEEVPSGYKVSYEYGDNLAVITNKKETITKKVEKVWADGEGNTIDAPGNVSIQVKLLQNGEVKETVELSGTTGWTHTWEGLPKYDEFGKEYIYIIKETAVTINGKDVFANYKTDISTSGETTIIKNIQIDSETVSKTVKKVWADEDGNTIDAPGNVSIQVKLLQNGEGNETVELSGTTGWTHTWEGLAKYDNDGKLIKYDIIEDSVSGYTPVYKVDGDITTITNKQGNTGEPISKTVKKVWLDSSGNTVTPAEGTKIQVQLSKDGILMTDTEDTKYTVELNSSNKWKCTWTDLENGHLYTVEEISVTVGESNVLGNYNITYSNDGEEIIVTNQEKTINEKVSKTVKKVWLDLSGNAITPAEGTTIEVQLYQNGTQMSDSYKKTLSSSNNWTAKWDDLDKYDSSGNEYQYTVTEVNVPEGYTVNYSINGDEIIVTNKENNTGEKVSKTVKKVWLDSSGNAITPAEGTTIDVQLCKNSKSMGDDYKKQLSSSNNWTDTWSNLDKYDSDGNEYQYTVIEVNVPEGYTAIYKDDGFTIQNKKIEYTNITVKKGWIDEEESHNPITVQLIKDGTPMTDARYTVELSSSNNWTCTWEKLPKTGAYTVQEKEVPEGYTATTMTTESDTDITFIIKNTKTDPDPDPEDPNNPPSKPDPEIQTNVVISGYVWNDMALNKTSNSYDGIYNADEKPLTGVGVYLYRTDNLDKPITSTSTVLGYYSFGDSSVGDKGTRLFAEWEAAETASENFIKGKRMVFSWVDENGKTWYEISNIWEKYYSYYIVFEYDGITYTSTEYHSFSEKTDLLDSNAKESGDKVSETREKFNNRFSTINKDSNIISYYTTNKDGYIPQSIHYYNSSMSIQSSTECIKMGDLSATKEIYLKYINLGLRGRDTFDLELTSDVEKVKVTINNQQGVYNYGNKVNLRRNDFKTRDDMANVDKETSNTYVDRQDQKIRSTDIGDALTEILVTYKITVQNASATAGTATKITNYYDSKYKYVGAYSDSSCEDDKRLETNNPGSGTGYKSIEIITPDTTLNQSDTMEIYVVYSYDIDNYKKDLISLEDGEDLATYNMAEITEYKTFTTTYDNGTNNEATRGLLDKDSAPGSATTEKVRLAPNLIGTQTTIEYYFGGNDLSKLKYEDDTYATPTLYFVKDSSERTITGTVFEDNTTTNTETKIKTGNGKLDDGEVGVYGATVLLLERINLELVDTSSEQEDIEGTNYNKYYALKDGENTIWYKYNGIKAISNEQGLFTLSGFLPGEYIIVYHYGDTSKTTLLCQSDDKNVNQKSYNGEDFQSANNTGTADSSKLNDTKDYWYVYNENNGISTGTDNVDRRLDVSKNVTGFIDEKMKALNNIRVSSNSDDVTVTYNDGAEKSVSLNDIIKETRMYANTKSMLFTVEKTELTTSETKQKTEFADYNIKNMNFGISAVPVTTVDLQKQISKLTITDSTGSNIIASYDASESRNSQKGVTKTDKLLYAQIEDEKLQGARLEIEYTISLNIETEVNFDSKIRHITPTITGLVDFVDNNLSYNEELGNNKDNWEIIKYTDVKNTFADQMYDEITAPEGTVDPNGEKYTTILKAKDSSSEIKNLLDGSSTVTLTLEKVLTAGDSLITEILDGALDTSTYNNIIEIIGFDYHNTSTGGVDKSLTFEEGKAGIDTDGDGTEDAYVMRDRIRTNITDEETGRKIEVVIIPGVQHDTASAETFVITPPTGDMSIAMIYLLVAILSLGILAGGIFGIKKFVIKK